MKPEDLDGSPFQQEYASVAPHPENWHRLVAKITDLDRTIEGWSREAIQSVIAPTLLIIGDSDIGSADHVTQVSLVLRIAVFAVTSIQRAPGERYRSPRDRQSTRLNASHS